MFGRLKNEVARAGGMGQVEEDQFLQQVRESPRANPTSLVVGWGVDRQKEEAIGMGAIEGKGGRPCHSVTAMSA